MFYRKLIIFFLLYLVSLYVSSDAHMPYDESADAKKNLSYTLNLAKKKEVFLLLEFGANYCPDCRQLAKLFKTEKINAWLNKRVIILPIDVGMDHEGNKDIAELYGNPVKSGIPSLVLLNPTGKKVFSTSKGELARARDIEAEDLFKWLEINLGPLIN